MKNKLSARNTDWVKKARVVGDTGENVLCDALRSTFPSHIVVSLKPRELSHIYGHHGVIPDLMIHNTQTDKRLFVEQKAGDKGGNAHERAYKYLSPTLARMVRDKFSTPEHPFLFVFSGETFKKKKYIEEITTLLSHIPNNYLLWDGSTASIQSFAAKVEELLR